MQNKKRLRLRNRNKFNNAMHGTRKVQIKTFQFYSTITKKIGSYEFENRNESTVIMEPNLKLPNLED